MSLVSIINSIFIWPLLSIYHSIFIGILKFTENPGLTIINFSILINLILLPVYYQMEQKGKDRLKFRNEMQKEINRMKKHYKGRERYFYTKTIYKNYKYSPFYVLISSMELYLQVLVFMTVYIYLTNLNALSGHSFIFIEDLGKPDRLVFGINLLPIIMTVANLISALFYTEDKSKRTQAFIMAGLFVVLLYDSPAALVLYWTSNNIFSLVKNFIIEKAKPHFSPKVKEKIPNLYKFIQQNL